MLTHAELKVWFRDTSVARGERGRDREHRKGPSISIKAFITPRWSAKSMRTRVLTYAYLARGFSPELKVKGGGSVSGYVYTHTSCQDVVAFLPQVLSRDEEHSNKSSLPGHVGIWSIIKTRNLTAQQLLAKTTWSATLVIPYPCWGHRWDRRLMSFIYFPGKDHVTNQGRIRCD